MNNGERLQSILTNEQKEAGFYLRDDEDFVYLYEKGGKLLGVFNAYVATAQSIRAEVESLMSKVK